MEHTAPRHMSRRRGNKLSTNQAEPVGVSEDKDKDGGCILLGLQKHGPLRVFLPENCVPRRNVLLPAL